jgi:DNA replication protein DnaC
MSDRETIGELLIQLRLRGMAQVLEDELERAERQPCSPAELVYRLLLEEARYRRERSLQYRLDQAKLPWPWTLESFPFERQPGLDRAQLRSLASLDFVRRADNLVLIGPPGTGKSGIAIALLREACLNGYRARFYNAQDLLDELYASLADRSSAKLLNRLARYDLLLIDELGYLTLKSEQANAFFKLMDQRYQRVSTVITTNLPYDAWYELFEKKTLVDALLDRLQHHCITIAIDGPSLRVPDPDPEPQPDPPTPAKKTRASKKTPQHKPDRQS